MAGAGERQREARCKYEARPSRDTHTKATTNKGAFDLSIAQESDAGHIHVPDVVHLQEGEEGAEGTHIGCEIHSHGERAKAVGMTDGTSARYYPEDQL